MSIKQFNGSYMPNEDRLLFRFNTNEDDEYRFWLTRRVSLFILAATDHLVEKKLEQQHEKPAAKAIAQFQQEAVKEQTKFTNDYVPANKYPLGADPVLVMDVKCAIVQVEKVDVLSLDFILPGGANLNLKLTMPILQTMRLLIERLSTQANWGELRLNLGGQQSAPLKAGQSDAIPDNATSGKDASKKLH
jgi:hypothetical protein